MHWASAAAGAVAGWRAPRNLRFAALTAKHGQKEIATLRQVDEHEWLGREIGGCYRAPGERSGGTSAYAGTVNEFLVFVFIQPAVNNGRMGTHTAQPRGPLSEVRVLDFTRVLSGPYCTALLADLGAEVVKVESPQGDEYRHIGPFRNGESALFQLVNRNKLGVVLDLKSAGDQELARRLACAADVVVENFRPGVADRLAIGYEALAAGNPRLVYASISGFGQVSTLASLPAFDLVAQARSGLMALTGAADGPPTKVGESIGDLAAGLFCSWAILAALYERERTGRGRRIDVGMVDSLVALLPTAVAQWMFGGKPVRTGNSHPLSTPFGVFRAADGHLVICVLNERQFAALAGCIGHPEMAADPRFATDAARTAHEPIVRAAIEAWLEECKVVDAITALTTAGVPASAIDEASAVFEGAYVTERELITRMSHPRLGTVAAMEQPVHFGGLPRGRQRPAPALGADAAEVISRWLSIRDAADARTPSTPS